MPDQIPFYALLPRHLDQHVVQGRATIKEGGCQEAVRSEDCDGQEATARHEAVLEEGMRDRCGAVERALMG